MTFLFSLASLSRNANAVETLRLSHWADDNVL
jgi:hypothetical protein